jgi:hypothetical protein
MAQERLTLGALARSLSGTQPVAFHACRDGLDRLGRIGTG